MYILTMQSIHYKNAMLISFVIVSIMLLLPLFFKNRNKLAKFYGYFILLAKLFDIVYRIFVEKYPFFNNMPFELCNIAIISAGIYLITKRNVFFNITYTFVYGAIITILAPSEFSYKTGLYIFSFIFTHVLIIFTVVFSFIYLRPKITVTGLIISIIVYILLVINALIQNHALNTSFMYLSSYIHPMLKYIPFRLYQVLLPLVNILAIITMWTLGYKIQKK